MGAIEVLCWTKFKKGRGEWTFRNNAPDLVKMLQFRGPQVLGKYRYKLSGDKFLVREPVA